MPRFEVQFTCEFTVEVEAPSCAEAKAGVRTMGHRTIDELAVDSDWERYVWEEPLKHPKGDELIGGCIDGECLAIEDYEARLEEYRAAGTGPFRDDRTLALPLGAPAAAPAAGAGEANECRHPSVVPPFLGVEEVRALLRRGPRSARRR